MVYIYTDRQTDTLSLSLSLSHTHTHTHWERQGRVGGNGTLDEMRWSGMKVAGGRAGERNLKMPLPSYTTTRESFVTPSFDMHSAK